MFTDIVDVIVDTSESLGRSHRSAASVMDVVNHVPPYLERNMIAPRHWNPPGV